MGVGVRKYPWALMVGWCAPMVADARPDDGSGLYTYEASDSLASWDEPGGHVRVHFSVAGPNATLLEDADADGVPDFPVLVGMEVAQVLEDFELFGFRRPVSESALGLPELGGSEALDVYLVDFAGSADGMFGVDRCIDGVCAGHLVIENDFSGYGYASVEEAARVLASHELFHGVQYAYTDDLDPWFSEGTATWAEHLYEPEVRDYLRFCSAYLADSGRSIDRPPAGVTTSFAYGTALFFGFVQETQGGDRVVAMLEALAEAGDGDEVAAIARVFDQAGTDFATVWPRFAAWNLATGPRAGGVTSYPYASALDPGIQAEVIGPSVVDDHRFYPLAASYFRLQHAGGELWFGLAEDNRAAVHFEIFPTSERGEVLPALLEWAPEQAEVVSLGSQPAGNYWLVGSFPSAADSSEKRAFCFGGADAMADCTLDEDVGDTGASDGDTAGPVPDTQESDENRGNADRADKSGGCTTLAAGHLTSLFALGLVGATAVGRRQT